MPAKLKRFVKNFVADDAVLLCCHSCRKIEHRGEVGKAQPRASSGKGFYHFVADGRVLMFFKHALEILPAVLFIRQINANPAVEPPRKRRVQNTDSPLPFLRVKVRCREHEYRPLGID
ncbi:hypothetical protein SDC9_194424 [bioreactor metagenome]|uniref:Uncharacterized protein n=1 Tax=bioreactor metagenome TaxID=1076179 RepID=A0A645I680_9ZZZZ